MAVARYKEGVTPEGPSNRDIQLLGRGDADIAGALSRFGERYARDFDAGQIQRDRADIERTVAEGGDVQPSIGMTDLGVARNTLAMHAYAARTSLELKQHVAELHGEFDGMRETDPENFAKRFDAYAEPKLASVPEQFRPFAADEVARLRSESLTRLTEASNRAVDDRHVSEIKAGMEADLQDALRYAHDGDPDGLARVGVKMNAVYDDLVASGHLSEGERQIDYAKAKDQIEGQILLGRFMRGEPGAPTIQDALNGSGPAAKLSLKTRDALARDISQEIGRVHAEESHRMAMQDHAIAQNDRFLSHATDILEAGGTLAGDDKKTFDALVGATPPVDPAKYTTKLKLSDEVKFQDWYAGIAKENGLDPNPDAPEHHYDWRGFWMDPKAEAATSPVDGKLHFPDTYKLPGHPTFSNEAKAAKDRPDLAGHWDGDNFVPPPSPGPIALASSYKLEEARAAGATQEISRQVATATLAQIQKIEASLATTQPTTHEQVLLRKIYADKLEKRRAGVASDPTGYAMRAGIIDPVVIPPPNDPGFDAALAQAAQNVGIVRSTLGVTASPFTKEQTQAFAATLSKLTWDEKAAVLGRVERAFGPYAAVVHEDLAKQGAVVEAHIGLVSSLGRPDIAASIGQGQEALDAKNVEMPKKADVARIVGASGIGAAYGYSQSAQKQIRKAAIARAAYLAGPGGDVAEHLEQAIKDVGGDSTTFNGKVIALPLGVDKYQFVDRVHAFDGREDVKAALESGDAQLDSLGEGRYAVTIGVTRAKNPDGSDFILDVTKLPAQTPRGVAVDFPPTGWDPSGR